ncbi:hypothetical protein Q427_29675 [Halomonas sp. BC04]|nr:hypothetical protein Q427_29675 [Halomonas sp. BC04]
MGQVIIDECLGEAIDAVTGCAVLAKGFSRLVESLPRCGWDTPLGQPGIVVVTLQRLDMQQHGRMLGTTELGTLGTENAGHIGFETDSGMTPGHHVPLASKTRDPERVDHIGAGETKVDGLTNRHHQPVGGDHVTLAVLAGIAHLPPPLMPDHLDKLRFTVGQWQGQHAAAGGRGKDQ